MPVDPGSGNHLYPSGSRPYYLLLLIAIDHDHCESHPGYTASPPPPLCRGGTYIVELEGTAVEILVARLSNMSRNLILPEEVRSSIFS